MEGKYQRLLRIDRGQSFKGHQAELSIDTLHNKTLSLHNTYFGGSIGFYYEINKNQTIKKIHTQIYTPKWLQKLYNDAMSISSMNKQYSPEFRFDNNKGISIFVNQYSIYATKEEMIKGCAFQNHRNNINDIKDLYKELSSVRKYIKNKTAEELVIHLHNYNDNYDTHDVQTIPLYSKAIKYIKETVARLFV